MNRFQHGRRSSRAGSRFASGWSLGVPFGLALAACAPSSATRSAPADPAAAPAIRAGLDATPLGTVAPAAPVASQTPPRESVAAPALDANLEARDAGNIDAASDPPAPSTTRSRSGGKGFGSLGLVGVGENGGGRGEGVGFNVGDEPRFVIKLGQVSVQGRLPPEIIKRIVIGRHAGYEACYEGALRSDPNARGNVTMKFTIDGRGKPQHVDGTFDLPPAFARCMVKVFASLSYPAPEGGDVSVEFSLQFAGRR